MRQKKIILIYKHLFVYQKKNRFFVFLFCIKYTSLMHNGGVKKKIFCLYPLIINTTNEHCIFIDRHFLMLVNPYHSFIVHKHSTPYICIIDIWKLPIHGFTEFTYHLYHYDNVNEMCRWCFQEICFQVWFISIIIIIMRMLLLLLLLFFWKKESNLIIYFPHLKDK